MNDIYFDNSATTAIYPEVIARMQEIAERYYGNPSSLHTLGVEAEKVLKEARLDILKGLGVRNPQTNQLVFTGSGTEANNLAVFGTAYAKQSNKGKKIITTDSEHPSVLECMKRLENDGFKVVKLSTRHGVIDINQLLSELDERTILISVMLVNNETGAIYDVKSIFEAAKGKNPDVVTHCDAVQGFMKVRFSPQALGADLVTISAHKIHGPKGMGALFIHPDIIKTKRLIPHICGGGQENGFRSGTENVVGAAGFAEAVKLSLNNFNTENINKARQYLIENLPENVRCNIPKGKFAPHILNITLPDIKSETMLHYLAKHGIYVSSGSACSSHSHHESYVLKAFGLDKHESDCSIRISLDDSVSREELTSFISALDEGINSLIKIK